MVDALLAFSQAGGIHAFMHTAWLRSLPLGRDSRRRGKMPPVPLHRHDVGMSCDDPIARPRGFLLPPYGCVSAKLLEPLPGYALDEAIEIVQIDLMAANFRPLRHLRAAPSHDIEARFGLLLLSAAERRDLWHSE